MQKQITAIAMGPGRDELWVGTYFSGLHHLLNGPLGVFTDQNGLPGSRVVCLAKGNDTIWIGTDRGCRLCSWWANDENNCHSQSREYCL